MKINNLNCGSLAVEVKVSIALYGAPWRPTERKHRDVGDIESENREEKGMR